MQTAVSTVYIGVLLGSTLWPLSFWKLPFADFIMRLDEEALGTTPPIRP